MAKGLVLPMCVYYAMTMCITLKEGSMTRGRLKPQWLLLIRMGKLKLRSETLPHILGKCDMGVITLAYGNHNLLVKLDDLCRVPLN